MLTQNYLTRDFLNYLIRFTDLEELEKYKLFKTGKVTYLIVR